jgi:ribosomal protein L37AE/L43A
MFTKGKKDAKIQLFANWIFKENFEESVQIYKDGNIGDDVTSAFLEYSENVEVYFECVNKDDPYEVTLWARVNLPGRMLQYLETLVHYNAIIRHKIKLFVDRHLPVVLKSGPYVPLGLSKEYPDDLSYVKRKTVEKLTLKPAPYEDTCDVLRLAEDIRENWNDSQLWENFISPKITYHPLRSIIDLINVKAYSVYCACIYVLHYDSKRYLVQHSFIDLFYHCLTHDRMDDQYLLGKSNIWEKYLPSHVRCFTGDDLPDYFHVLLQIPLKGEVDVDDFPLMKIILKCMPFACQRRQLLVQIEELCKDNISNSITNERFAENEAFWRFFSKIMWCCLSGAYPKGVTVRPDFRKLMRIKYICTYKEILMDALTRRKAEEDADGDVLILKRIKKERENNCLIVFTAFRLYILHMASYNPHYVEYASEFVDWEAFEKETYDMGDVIRASNLFCEDVFAEARFLLKKTNKNEKREVYRFRKHSCESAMLFETNQILEKVVYPNTVYYTNEIRELKRYFESVTEETFVDIKDLTKQFHSVYKYTKHVCNVEEMKEILKKIILLRQVYLEALEKPLNVETKEKILNALVKVPENERLTAKYLSILMHENYGNIQAVTVCVMLNVIDLYRKDALPQVIKKEFDLIPIEDIRAVTWYFGVCVSLARVSFAPLDFETVSDINKAMINYRHPTFTGFELPQKVYDVIYTICCKSVATMLGKKCFGHRKVTFDVREKIILCNKAKKDISDCITKGIAAGLQTEKIKWKTERVRNRDMRLGFHGYPCNNQPVLIIPLKMHMLLIGNKAKKIIRYMRCPRCACLHIFDPTRYQGDSYCCEECAREDFKRHQSGSVVMTYQCSYCKVGGPSGHMAGQTSKPRVRERDILIVVDAPKYDKNDFGVYNKLEPDQYFQYLRFCRKCYKAAKRFNYIVTKEQLMKNIETKLTSDLKRFNY